MNPIQDPPINTPLLNGNKVSNIWMMWFRSLVGYINDTNTVAFNASNQMIPLPAIVTSAPVEPEQLYPMMVTTQSSGNEDAITLHWMGE